MELTGAEIVVKCLQAEGVEYVFGYPAARSFSLRRVVQAGQGQAHPRSPRQGATHAADGYSRSSDKVGVALVTSGPVSPMR